MVKRIITITIEDFNEGIKKKQFELPTKNKMEPISKDQSIVKQSSLKVVKDVCELLDYKPKSLAEVFRINDIVVEYCLFGTQPEIKKDIKRLDDHIKKSKEKDGDI